MFADQNQMFDIITPDEYELALSVKVECVDNAEARLPGAASRHPQLAPEGEPKHEQNEKCRNQKRHGCGNNHQSSVFDQSTYKGLHRATRLPCSFN
ncbi:MAG: hypothetical protein ACLPID_09975 [Beijerinckiaceae bacterium]